MSTPTAQGSAALVNRRQKHTSTDDGDVEPCVRVAVIGEWDLASNDLAEKLSGATERLVIVNGSERCDDGDVIDVAVFDSFGAGPDALRRLDSMLADDSVRRILVYTWDLEDEFSSHAMKRAIDGVVSKTEPPESLSRHLLSVVLEDGDWPSPPEDHRFATLTEREREVLLMMASGATNREVGQALFISLDTVKTHVKHLLRKLGVRNRTEAALLVRS